MSFFGSEKVGTAILIACGIAVPIFGWWPLVAASIIVIGWLMLVVDANEKFNPNGTRKHDGEKHGRNKRGSGRPGDMADR